MWIIIGLVVPGAIYLLWSAQWFHKLHGEEELGTVSRQWLAEYRQNHES